MSSNTTKIPDKVSVSPSAKIWFWGFLAEETELIHVFLQEYLIALGTQSPKISAQSYTI